jgi:hypothetical protein
MSTQLQGDLFGFAQAQKSVRTIAASNAREQGVKRGRAALEAAVSAGFDSDGARRFIVGQLRRHGPMTGEALVAAAKVHGFDPKRHGKDDRAFGSIFLAAQRQGEIRCLRSDLPREKGHGTSGGRLWESVT